jgi:3-hydroxyisobutyrate dehydrogenase-like beta-hydroxyacid dehydrogenase
MTEQKTVGFMGLGRMGTHMARNLASSWPSVVVFNRTRATADRFAAAQQVSVAGSGRELAERCDVIVSMLADGDALLATYLGDDGVLAGLRPGAVAVDMGTSGPAAVVEVGRLVEEAGGRMIDAPVSGSTPAAEAATLLIMVGATAEDFAEVEPILTTMGNPELVGPPGSAATLKLAVNSILYGLNQALAEAVILAEASGVAAAKMLDVVARSAVGAPMVSYRTAQYLDPDNAPVTFTLDLAEKDLELALERAHVTGTSMPQAEKTLAIIKDLVALGFGDRDLGFVIEGTRRTDQHGRSPR